MLKQNIEDAKKSLEKYDFPQDIIIETTSYCNLKCIMCPQCALTRPKGNMQFPLFKKIIDEVSAVSTSTRIWLAIMGEPLLLKNGIIKMIEYAAEKNLSTHLNTNAVFLDNDISVRLIKGGLTEIIIGIDATTNETYKKIRIGGDFNKVVSNTQFFINSRHVKPKVIVQFIEMEENKHETDDFKNYWLSRGATVKIRPRLGWGTGVQAKNLIIPDSERTFPCPWITRTVSIHWNGNIVQCDGDWNGQYSVGNIDNMTIKEAWTGELAKRREKHWNNDFNFKPCSECKDWQSGRSYYYEPDKK